MKIAIVGKGGSGKSSISRLLTHYLMSRGEKVMAIDSDHNMDFIDLLGYTFTRQTPTFKESYDDLFYFLGESPKLLKPRHLVQKYLGQKKFSLFPMDDFTTKIAIEYEKMLCLGVVGLGSDDVIQSSRCAHGISSALMAWLALVDEKDYTIVVDGVAGVDMINFGLYHTCDYVIIVVEPTRNSIKVAQQIYHLCEKSNINYGFVINKSLDSNSLEQLYDCLPHKILACLAYDKGLFAYNYQEISSETKQQVETLYNFLSSYRGFDLYERLMKLHSLKGIS